MSARSYGREARPYPLSDVVAAGEELLDRVCHPRWISEVVVSQGEVFESELLKNLGVLVAPAHHEDRGLGREC